MSKADELKAAVHVDPSEDQMVTPPQTPQMGEEARPQESLGESAMKTGTIPMTPLGEPDMPDTPMMPAEAAPRPVAAA
eukprot:3712130-Pyramimonas_sp.AAC.1